MRLRKTLRYLAIPAFITVLLILFGGIFKRSLEADRLIVAEVEIGRIEDALAASGIVVPEFEQVFTSPIPSRIEQVYHLAGDQITAGEQLLVLNTESIQLQLDRLKEELELQVNRKTQLELQLEKRVNELQAQMDIQTLQIALFKTRLERRERLHKLGAETEDALNEARLNLQIAQREKDLMTSQISNEERKLLADLREVDLKITIQQKLIKDVELQIAMAQVRSDRAGVVTWVKDDIGASILAGDVVARVADLSSYKVEARITDIHAAKLRVGQQVRVRFKERHLHGEITSVNPSVENGIASFIVELEERRDPLLRTNLRVDVDVITSFKDSVLRVKNGPAFPGSGKHYAYVIENDRALKRSIRIGASNLDYVEIVSGLNAGERVIISDMDEFKTMTSIAIKAR